MSPPIVWDMRGCHSRGRENRNWTHRAGAGGAHPYNKPSPVRLESDWHEEEEDSRIDTTGKEEEEEREPVRQTVHGGRTEDGQTDACQKKSFRKLQISCIKHSKLDLTEK